MVTIVLPVRRDPRTAFAARGIRAFGARCGLDAEIITCSELSRVGTPTADCHVVVKPAYKGSCVRPRVLDRRGSAVLVLDAGPNNGIHRTART